MADRRPRGGGACPGQHDCAGGGGAGRVGRAALRTGHGAACSRARRRAWEACPGCQPACLGRGPGAARWRHPRTLPVPACAAARSAANCGQPREHGAAALPSASRPLRCSPRTGPVAGARDVVRRQWVGPGCGVAARLKQSTRAVMALSLLSLHQGARRLSLPGPCARHRGALPPSAMRQPFASEASCVRRLRAPRGSTRGIRHNFQPHPHQRARPQLRPAPHPCPRARQLASPYRQTWRARAKGRQPPLPPPPSHTTNHVQRRQPLVGRLQAAPSAAR